MHKRLAPPPGVFFVHYAYHCQVHRPYLNDYRKEVWDEFVNDLKSEVVAGRTKTGIEASILTLVRKFKRDAELQTNEYLAFRRYAIKNYLAETLQEILV